MVSNENIERPEDITRREREDIGSATEAERIRADGVDEPTSVSGLTDEDADLATNAERIRADGVDEPTSVSGPDDRDLLADRPARMDSPELTDPSEPERPR